MEGIAPFVTLAGEIVKRVNSADLQRHNNAMTKLKNKINEEKARGQLSDDGRIEEWTKEFWVEADAFLRQLALLGVNS